MRFINAGDMYKKDEYIKAISPILNEIKSIIDVKYPSLNDKTVTIKLHKGKSCPANCGYQELTEICILKLSEYWLDKIIKYNDIKTLRHILVHEICHAIDFFITGDSKHNKLFKSRGRDFNEDLKSTINVEPNSDMINEIREEKRQRLTVF